MYMPAQIQLKTVKTVEIEPESDVPQPFDATGSHDPAIRGGRSPVGPRMLRHDK